MSFEDLEPLLFLALERRLIRIELLDELRRIALHCAGCVLEDNGYALITALARTCDSAAKSYRPMRFVPKRFCLFWELCRPYGTRINFPLYPGLACTPPRAKAARAGDPAIRPGLTSMPPLRGYFDRGVESSSTPGPHFRLRHSL